MDRREIAAVFIGGSLGTLARAEIAVWVPPRAGHWPWATLSTWMFESRQLARGGDGAASASNLALSLAAGLLSPFSGTGSGRGCERGGLPDRGGAVNAEVFHVELRQSFHSARAFNLSEQELRERVLKSWLAGGPLIWAEREWLPRKAKLTIINSRELRPDEIGMGRGWQEAVRVGEDVTEQMLTAGGPERPENEFKPMLRELCSIQPRSLAEIVRAADRQWPQARFSERVAIVEQAVWELLHEGVLRMQLGDGGPEPVALERWRELLLASQSWWPNAELRLVLAR